MTKNRWICFILLLALTQNAASCTNHLVIHHGKKQAEETIDRPAADSKTEAPNFSPTVPDAWHVFEYDGVKYDLWEIYSELQGVWEWGRIGKYVVVQAYVNKDSQIFALINTETQKIEHHFVGTVFTCHSDDIHTIVSARDNTICSFDGTLFVELALGAGEYIRELAYSDDRTQVIITIETSDSSMRTETIDLKPNTDGPTHHTQAEDTTEIHTESPIKLDDIVKAYQTAAEAASWFRIASLLETGNQDPINMSDEVIENDFHYFRIKQFDSYSAFIDYLGAIFSDKLIESFLTCNGTMYIDHHGYLYGRFGMRGTNIFMGKETYEMKYIHKEKVHLLVNVEVMEEDLSTVKEYQTFIFPYENIGGKWVFTDFPEIR